MVAAGPAVHVIMVCLILALLDVNHVQPLAGAIALAFVISNVWLFAASMWPSHHWRGQERVPNDGMLLWHVSRMQSDEIKIWHAHYYYLEAMECRERHRPAAAAQWLERGTKAYPDDQNMRVGQAALMLDAVQADEARTLLFDILSAQAEDSVWVPFGCSYIAWACVLSGRPELLPEADNFSERAYGAYPWHGDVAGIRGRVLIATQRDDEGRTLLETMMKEDESVENRAHNACYMALSYARHGDREKSNAYLAIAHKLDKDCASIAVVQRQLANAEAARANVTIADAP